MSVTRYKSKLFTLTVAIDDERIAQMKKAPELANAALQKGAEYWHSNILPLHFKEEAHAKYDYAFRSKNYRKENKGRPDLVHSGSLKNDLKARATYIEQAKAVLLTMSARVLNFVPRMSENDPDKYVIHRGARGNWRKNKPAKKDSTYPNLKREIRMYTEDEREAVAQEIVNQLEIAFGPSINSDIGV